MSKRREVALEVIAAYNAWDIERIMGYRAENCIQQVAPKSLQRPPMDNATYRKYFGSMMPLFHTFDVTIHELVEDDKANKTTIWCSSKADTVLGPYGNEYMMLLYFNDAGDKVEKVIEFVDSDYSKVFFGRLMKHAAEQQPPKIS